MLKGNKINKKNLLIVCLNRKDISMIKDINFSGYKNITVASDDLEVHDYCNKLDLINHVTFIQKAISYPKVLNGVIEIIDRVNLYFDKISKLNLFNKKEIFWTYQVDGGYTTQRVQEILLTIECFTLIFKKYNINEVIGIGHKSSLTIKILERVSALNDYNLSLFNKRQPILKNKIKDNIRPIYFLVRSIYNKITSKRDKRLVNNIILFQICGSSAKHIQNALFPQKDFLKSEFNPLNIIWGNTKEVNNINQMGYKAISMESYLKYSHILLSIYKGLLVFLCSKKLKKLFFDAEEYLYKGINVSDLIYESIFQYLYTDGPENYRYRNAAKRFRLIYSDHIVAIKYCAAKFLAQGTILSELLEDKYLKFDYEVGLQGPQLYKKFNSMKHLEFFSNNFYKFAPNEIERKYLIEYMNIPSSNAIKFGAGRASVHFKNNEVLNKNKSRSILGIKKEYDINILLNFNGSLAGFESLEEVIYLSETLIEFAKNNQNIALIIKPHPSANLSPLKYLINGKTQNIYLVDKNALPDNALNISDVMFCKYSTMGMEAMIYDVQVVSVLLDNENVFKFYGNSAKYIYKKNELSFFLNSIFSSKDKFMLWKKSYQEKREKFVKDYYPELDLSSGEIIVKTISENIIKRNYKKS